MKSAKIAELKNNLSRYLDCVKAGGTVTVLDRDRPIARIVSLSRSGGPRRDATTPGWIDSSVAA